MSLDLEPRLCKEGSIRHCICFRLLIRPCRPLQLCGVDVLLCYAVHACWLEAIRAELTKSLLVQVELDKRMGRARKGYSDLDRPACSLSLSELDTE